MNIVNGREVNLVRGIHNALQLHKMIVNVLERTPPINHHVQNTPKRPHITGSTNLPEKKYEKHTTLRSDYITKIWLSSFTGV